jgi:hypothetical protein
MHPLPGALYIAVLRVLLHEPIDLLSGVNDATYVIAIFPMLVVILLKRMDSTLEPSSVV